MKFNIPVHVIEHRDNHGRKTGRVSAHVGEREIFAESLQSLQHNVAEFIVSASRRPEMAVVRHRDNLAVLVSHVGETDTLIPVDDAANGLVLMRCLSFNCGEILESARALSDHWSNCFPESAEVSP